MNSELALSNQNLLSKLWLSAEASLGLGFWVQPCECVRLYPFMEWWGPPEVFLVNSQILNTSNFNSKSQYLVFVLIVDNLSS